MATPTSTYRLQFRAGFTLDDGAELTGYLAELGVDAVYCSPLLTAVRGSDHGYDTTDPTRVDPERGGEAGWERFVAAARTAGLKIVVDIVPNHLGVADPQQNPSWWSVLRDGPDSEYASWYDIDWSRPITLAVLADDDLADLAVDTSGRGEPRLAYFEHRFPLAPGTYAPGDDAAEVHGRQHYRLIDWRLANTELNYRRFFAVNTLAGLRVEDDRVFDATHARILRWVNEDGIDGLRIDHPDGLADPTGYLERLRTLAPSTWIVAEKILEPGEHLPDTWPIAGTTGYDALTEVLQVLVDPAAEGAFTELYADLTGDRGTVTDQIRAGKTMVAERLFDTEVSRICRLLGAPGDPDTARTLRALAVAVEVYRSYLPVGVDVLDDAAAAVRHDAPDLSAILDRIVPRLRTASDEAAIRFQQLTGPVMAKGVEDTAWYRYNRFVALNEVGGDPGRFALAVADFHRAQQRRQHALPEAMTALSTHDTKRGEDVRARLAALSELPAAWAEYARDFLRHTALPDAGLAYLLAQTLVGTGPIDRDRMHAYAEKAMREAAVHTGWDDPDEDFERAVHAAVDLAYDHPSLRDHLERLLTVCRPAGRVNALAQKLVQLTMPGVPDLYQGTERWEDSLVDPDNRRPVDFTANRELLGSLSAPPPIDADGAAKLWLVRQTLRLRRDRPELFSGYTPVYAAGTASDHLLAFDRGGAITLVTRLPITLGERNGWGDTTVRLDGAWVDELSGGTVTGEAAVQTLFATYPVALLRRL